MKFISVFILSTLFIHQVSGQAVGHEKKIRLNFYAGGGLALYQPIVGGHEVSGMGSLKFKPDLTWTYSNGIDFRFRKFENIIARLQVSVSEFIYKAEGTPPTIAMDALAYTLTGYNVTPNVSVLYQFLNDKQVRLYAGAGLNFHSPRYTRSHVSFRLADDTNWHTDYIELSYNDPVLAPEIKAGLFCKRFELNANAAYGRIVKEKSYTFNIASYSLNVFYHFY